MWSAATRALFGFIAAVISVLTFQQAMIALLHSLGLSPYTAYRTNPEPPWGLPLLAGLCLWGGLYGLVFGLLLPRFTWPGWLCGIGLGIIAALIAMFVGAPIEGAPIAYGWHAWPVARSLLIYGFWGLGVGLILPRMLPRRSRRARLA